MICIFSVLTRKLVCVRIVSRGSAQITSKALRAAPPTTSWACESFRDLSKVQILIQQLWVGD
jgi:hypothetical protein